MQVKKESSDFLLIIYFKRRTIQTVQTVQTVTSNKPKCQGLSLLWGCVSALGKGNLHFCDGTINAGKYIEILEQHICCFQDNIFSGTPMHISTRQYNTTFCTHYKGMAAEEEGADAGLACLQSRPTPNRKCVAHF